MSIRLYLVLFIVALVPNLLSGQNREVRFEASADAKQIVLGNYVEVSFSLHNAKGIEFRPPRFTHFDVVSGPNKFSRATYINGVGTSVYGFSYTLRPQKVGKFRIEKASMKADGKVYNTEVLVVEVVKGKNSDATTQKDLDANLEEEIFILVEPSALNAYTGQQITLDFKLYTTQSIKNYDLRSMPEFQGFFAEDIRHFDSRVLKEVIDGKQYNTKILERIALFPQQTGLLKIEPTVWELAVLAEDQPVRRSIFYSPKVRRFNVVTEALNINVQSPPLNAPLSFNGAVGIFNAFTNINKRVLSTDDAVSLKMTVKGDGDIKRVLPPPLLLSDTFEIYEPRIINEESTERGGRIISSRTFEYLVLPKVPGRYQISPSFSYFDPDTMLYMMIPLDTFPLDVRQGTGKTNYNTAEEEIKTTVAIRDIKLMSNFQEENTYRFFGSGFFWTLLILPFLLLGSAYFYKQYLEQQKNVDISLLKMKGASKVAQQKLTKAKEFLNQQNSKSFYDEISNASLGYVCDKLNIPIAELTKANVKEKLSSIKVEDNYIDQLMRILQTCEMARFAGKDNVEAMQETYQNTIQVITDIEEQITKKG